MMSSDAGDSGVLRSGRVWRRAPAPAASTDDKANISSVQISPSLKEADEASAKAAAAAASAFFNCNVCFDTARNPVVSLCGHLYCWSCLYRWLQISSDAKLCPVCKGVVSEPDIIPIYGCGVTDVDLAMTVADDDEQEIPPRPSGRRVMPEPVVNVNVSRDRRRRRIGGGVAGMQGNLERPRARRRRS
ncbi:E3 ubiquitin-protein ligase RMA1 [Acorus calamus]|uniref:E3 ubiquitin-protein ligase RMA n=1 Tax=Acorus calamus TaxID=4465 RepID=A0AAV9F4A6_ACOCL|nr:E3 ubiquitin-protein ligase RMA1 [Acorus calamus]